MLKGALGKSRYPNSHRSDSACSTLTLPPPFPIGSPLSILDRPLRSPNITSCHYYYYSRVHLTTPPFLPYRLASSLYHHISRSLLVMILFRALFFHLPRGPRGRSLLPYSPLASFSGRFNHTKDSKSSKSVAPRATLVFLNWRVVLRRCEYDNTLLLAFKPSSRQIPFWREVVAKNGIRCCHFRPRWHTP